MASDRDGLAAYLTSLIEGEAWADTGEVAAEHVASALGWRPPARTVSEDEANRLLPGAIVRRGGKAWEREHGLWWHGGLLDGYTVPYGSAPITVLYDPAEEDDR